MKTHKTTLISIALALGIAAAVVAGLISDYGVEQEALKRVPIVQAEATLATLKAGIGSHRRFARFAPNIDMVLEDAAQAPGIMGLAIYLPDGNRIGVGGEMPNALRPKTTDDPDGLEARWLSQGILCFRKSVLAAPDSPFMGMGMAMGMHPGETAEERSKSRGAGGMGEGPPRRGQRGMGGPFSRGAPMGWTPEDELEVFSKPVWIAVLLDRSQYDKARGKATQRFAITIAITLTAVSFGLALIALVRRQSRLGAELSLGREREKRLEERSQLGAGLAHETKNPLCLIRGLSQSMLNKSSSRCLSDAETIEEHRRNARQIIDEVDRVVGRVNSFLEYARSLSPHAVEIQLDAILAETVELFQDEAKSKGVRLETHLLSTRAKADPSMLRQMLVNLLVNSLAATRSGDSILVALENGGSRGNCAITIRDSGEGIAPDDLSQVIKPYFTRREGGTGLGLSIVDQIAQSHGWRLDIESAPNKGTSARLTGIAVLTGDHAS